MSTYFIGFKGDTACGSEETKRQIEKVKNLECRLCDPDTPDKKLSWADFDNPKEPRTLFQSIIKDRVMRIDKKTPMADRPSFAVVTAFHDKALRLEYYEGHDELKLVYDIRSRELQGKELPVFLESDPFRYDPVEYLLANFPSLVEAIGGASETKKILDQMHEKEKKPASCRNAERSDSTKKTVR